MQEYLQCLRQRSPGAHNLRVIARTERIPYDAYVIRSGFPTEAILGLQKALSSVSTRDADGREALKPLGDINGFIRTDDTHYKSVREVEARVQSLLALPGGTLPTLAEDIEASHDHLRPQVVTLATLPAPWIRPATDDWPAISLSRKELTRSIKWPKTRLATREARRTGEVIILRPTFRLQLFSEKDGRQRGGLQSYNHQTLSWFTGPGRFSIRQDGNEVLFDYTNEPKSAVEKSSAEIEYLRNEHPVYGHMIDRVRRVSIILSSVKPTRNQ